MREIIHDAVEAELKSIKTSSRIYGCCIYSYAGSLFIGVI